ncbi:hypothetical protein L9F63_023661, partial [Diploptera punctata]
SLNSNMKGKPLTTRSHLMFIQLKEFPSPAVLSEYAYLENLQEYSYVFQKESKIVFICSVENAVKVVAVAEKGEKPSITIYDLERLKKRRVLGQSLETMAEEFISLAFSFDGKYLAAVLGDPDWTTVYYHWDKGKIDSTIKPSTQAGGVIAPVTQVACNPNDNSVLVLVGPQLFRLLSASEKIWRQYGWSKTESLNFTCVTWLSFDRVIAGTFDGRLVIIDGGELRAIYRALDVTEIHIRIQDEIISPRK